MKNQYRIKEVYKWEHVPLTHFHLYIPSYEVQMKLGIIWIPIKTFFNSDVEVSKKKAEELLNMLNK